MKILMTNLKYNGITGSEMYTYELSRTLVKLGHEVDILSPAIGGKIAERTVKAGVGLDDTPKHKKYDVLHLHHKPFSEWLLEKYPQVPAVNVIHSEYISPWEDPIISPQVKKYLVVRPSIIEKLTKFGIPNEKISVVCNPVDGERFRPQLRVEHPLKMVLFVGTNDYLREKVIKHLSEDPKRVILTVGEGWINPPRWDIENLVGMADETAGIMLGRTTIESWMCNRPAWIYNVDKDGEILNYKLHEPPQDLEKYDRFNVARQMEQIYQNLC